MKTLRHQNVFVIFVYFVAISKMSSYNKPQQPRDEPMLLRMLHPTSGQQGFNAVNTQTTFPSSPPVDPRLAMTINAQTQRAIGASGSPFGLPYSGPTYPQYSPYMYGMNQPYSMYPRR